MNASQTFFFKVGDQFTEIRGDDGKTVVANWTLKGMEKKLYLRTRWTQGTDEFRREDGCRCDKCDCDISHIRYSHVVYPRDILRVIKSTTEKR